MIIHQHSNSWVQH